MDDASTDGTRSVLASYGDAIRVVTHKTNTCFAASCNDGASAASGQYLVFLNNDTLPLKGWLDALVRYAEANEEAAVVGSKLLFPDNTIQHAGVAITEDRNPRHIYMGFPQDHPVVNKSGRFPIVTAACALFRRAPFEEAGGFDDSFVNGFEDVDLCLRLGELGYEVHYCHEAVLYHLEMATRDDRDLRQNLELYRRRWAHKVQPDAVLRYMEDGLLDIRFAERYPFFLRVSPRLALLDDESHAHESDQLLAERSRQVFELGRQNVLLRVQLAEAGVTKPELSLPVGPATRRHEPRAVYFISDTPGDPMRYRCHHHAEELALLGATADVSLLGESELGTSFESFGCFVLHRVPISEGIEAFIRRARELDKTVLFDIDDLVFASSARGLDFATMPHIDRQVLEDRFEPHSRALAMCDAVLVTTEPLARHARELNDRVFVVPNAASKEMVRLADAALASAQKESKFVTIAYLSGTPTHDRDFLHAADGVLSALETDRSCRLLVVGNLTLDSRFERNRDRITTVPLQPWQRLPTILAGVDINLAPLEPDNPFTESKSCLKYIEAGLLGVPTIASPRADFKRAIDSGRNGILAETPEEWQEALEQLVGNSALREAMGRAAYDDVRAHHTTAVVAPRLYETINTLMNEPGAFRSLTIHVRVQAESLSPQRADYLSRVITHLQSRGHRVRVFGNGEVPLLAEQVEVEPVPAQPNGLADIAVAADVESALIVSESSDALFRLYLVDDLIDGHTAVSRSRLSQALDLPIRPVCLGDRLAEELEQMRGMPVDRLTLPLEPERFEEMLRSQCFVDAASLVPAASPSGE